MAWNITGQYVETCSCDFLCPCPLTGLQETTHGWCVFAMGFRVDRGQYDDVNLAGRRFVVIGRTPGAMAEGNWQVGLIVDEQATSAQQEALAVIVSGQAGGPMANIAPMIGNFLGVEKKPVSIEGSGNSWSVTADGAVEQGVEAATGLGGEALHLDNTGHPANTRLGLARSTGSHVRAFGIEWEDQSRRNNGHFAPFDWSG